MFCWISNLLVVLQTLLLIMGDGENYDKVEEQTYSYYSSGRLQEAKNEHVLVRLVNSVKKRDRKQTLKEAQNCLGIAVERVKKDPNWIAQVVTVYTILYTDSIGSQNYEDAHYYVDKAIETAQLGIKVLDPSIAYRLLGSAYLGKASIYMPKRRWSEASELYRQGAEAYEVSQDHFMHAEALRMCAGCWEHLGEKKLPKSILKLSPCLDFFPQNWSRTQLSRWCYSP